MKIDMAVESLSEHQADGSWRCHSCAHECVLQEGAFGRCGLRSVQRGTFIYPHGRISSLAIDPMEKKPLYHVKPGGNILSFGGLGCNFTCPFCQNWEISQVGHDADALATDQACTASQLVDVAIEHGCVGLAATYNEPLISTEWVAEILGQGRQAGLLGCLISNGFASPMALDALIPCLDAANIDLKCFTDEHYRQLGGRLEPVKRTLEELHRCGVWLEVTTLVVPGFNEGVEELTALAEFLASVSVDLPWHLSAWHDDYQWHPGPFQTSLEVLEKAYELGKAAGLHYIYTGNVSRLQAHGDTDCPSCGRKLIQRQGFGISDQVMSGGRCPGCGASIPGLW